MPFTITDRTIALAAIFQAARLVQQVANTGNVDQQEFETSIQSLFRIDIDKAKDAFNGVHTLSAGLETLMEQLGGRAESAKGAQPKDLNITKYVAGILVLERRLIKNPAMLQTLSEGVERAQAQAEHFSLTHENVIAGLGHVYSQTISTLKPRIMVQGEHLHISNEANANSIRALLLAAIRATVLWRQCGGTRWQLFFQRRAILDEAQRLLADS